jgi:hypothetical protein
VARLKVGDYVLAIDGQELRAGDNYWRILNHALNEYVAVTGGGRRRRRRPRRATCGSAPSRRSTT